MNEYDDIIGLSHFHDPEKPFMTLKERAAQFAPYKSLVGYDKMIETETRELLELDD